jgi:hypothetical protein
VRGDALGECGGRRTVRLHAHCVNHRVRTATVSQLAYHLGKIIFMLPEIDHLDAPGEGSLQPRVHQVHRDDRVDPPLLGDPAGHVADRSEAQNEQRATVGHTGVLTPCHAVGSTSDR